MKRKIAAIIAADVAGYSRLVEHDEEDTLRRFFAASAVFKSLVNDHYGRVFNTAGDAILAEFPSSVEAVRCAASIQARVRDLNAGQPDARRLQFRIGISVGDVIEHETDLLGDGVNIAARLQTLATPGGLSISHWVQEQIAGKTTLAFRDAGWHNVRNIAKPVHVFLADIGTEQTPFTAPPPATPAPRKPFPRNAALITTGIVSLIALAVFWPRPTRPTAPPDSVPVIATSPVPARPVTIEPSPPPNTIQPAAVTPLAPSPPPPASVAPPQPTPLPEAKPSTPAVAAKEQPAAQPEPQPALTAPPREPAPAPEPKPAALPLPLPAQPAPSATRPRSATLCAEIRERAQLGDISKDERDLLRSACR